MIRRKLFFVLFVAAALAIGVHLFAKKTKAASGLNTSAVAGSPTINSVTAYTKYGDDSGYTHCFYQRLENNLYFDVTTDASTKSVNFVLVNLYNPNNPTVAEPATDWPVNNGKVTITIKGEPRPNPPHLGPGPYVAALTPSDGAAKAKSGAGVAYPYGTWKTSRDKECPIPK